jgi:hypothetical protein
METKRKAKFLTGPKMKLMDHGRQVLRYCFKICGKGLFTGGN